MKDGSVIAPVFAEKMTNTPLPLDKGLSSNSGCLDQGPLRPPISLRGSFTEDPAVHTPELHGRNPISLVQRPLKRKPGTGPSEQNSGTEPWNRLPERDLRAGPWNENQELAADILCTTDLLTPASPDFRCLGQHPHDNFRSPWRN